MDVLDEHEVRFFLRDYPMFAARFLSAYEALQPMTKYSPQAAETALMRTVKALLTSAYYKGRADELHPTITEPQEEIHTAIPLAFLRAFEEVF